MTIEELELHYSSKVVTPTIQLPIPLVIGQWQCKECLVWVDGTPQDKCGWCERYEENMVTLNNSDDYAEYLPKHIFKRLNEHGEVVYAIMNEDGRVEDLD